MRRIRTTTATEACRRDLTKELLADLRRVDAKIKTNEGQMRDALAATTTTLPQVHGIGIFLAAKLLEQCHRRSRSAPKILAQIRFAFSIPSR